MKNTLKIMVLLLVAATITSCSKQPQIYGTWKITEVALAINGEPINEPGMTEAYGSAIVGHTLEFRKDGTVIADGNEESVGHITLKGNEVIFKDAIHNVVDGVEELHDATGTIQTLTDTDMSIDFLYPAEYTDLDADVHAIWGFVRE
ncbi:MAG: hypothetical protein IJ622_04540 [Bacteroidales bacterium]|nr:hypothetical protein [Bacteroidales bacterium]